MSLLGMAQVSTAIAATPITVQAGWSEVPMRAGSTPAVAQAACVAANGTWDSTNNACSLPNVPQLPSYCNWVPFATSLFSECALPTAADLTNVGAYSAYEIGMANNDPTQTASLMADNATDSASLLANETTCAYSAAQNYPAISQILGPDIACALTDPTSATFWIMYAVLGMGAYVLVKAITK